MQDKKNLLWMINLFLIYFAVCIFQDNYIIPKELLLNINQIKDYCSVNSIASNCVSAMDIKSLINTNYSELISVKVYTNIFVVFQYLKYFLLAMNIMILFVFCRQKRTSTDNKVPLGLIILFSLLASYKFIYLYTNNITAILFEYIAIVVLLSCLIFISIFYLMKYYSKNNKVSVLFALYFCFLIYNTNYVNITSVQLFNIIFIILVMITSDNIINFLKVFTISLLCLCTVNAGYKFVTQYNFNFKNNNAKSQLTNYKITKNPKSNIYIFLFDMYGGSESLEKIYDYNNSLFIKQLREQGFYVNDNINSNYNRTLFTISSCLNFKYIDDIEYETASEAISYSEFFKIAKQLSYKIYYFNSYPIGMTATEDIIDYSFSTDNKMYLVVNLFFNNTIFYSYVSNLLYKDEINIVFNTLYNLIKYFPKPGKKLMFFHFLMPHNPFLYDENGMRIEGNNREYSEKDDMQVINKKNYIQYLKYTNKRILELIQFVKENDKNNPIIIVMGDHGSRAEIYIKNYKTHIKNMDKSYYLSHFNTILAYYNTISDYSLYKENDLLNFYINFSNEVFGTDIKNIQPKHFCSDLIIPIIKMKDTENTEVEY